MRSLASIPAKIQQIAAFPYWGEGVANFQKRIDGVEFAQKIAANAISMINILRFV